MRKVTSKHTTVKLELSLVGDSSGSTMAHISYEITAIGEDGDKFLEEFTEERYEGFMLEWEKQMDHFLDTGKKII